MVHDERAIVAAILAGDALPATCQHGAIHGARLLKNGLSVAEQNRADRAIRFSDPIRPVAPPRRPGPPAPRAGWGDR